jgi:holo-[acyl-carrier protein] synthase
MILGIGTDIIKVERVAHAFKRHGMRFAQRILTASEYTIFLAHHQPSYFLAKRFAAKEALVKALGTGFRQGIDWHTIEIKNTESGKPIIELMAGALAIYHSMGASHIHLSLTDEKTYALAFVVIS